MNCRRVEKLIALYEGGDLAPDATRAVAEHLRVCAGCRDLATGFEASREFLRTHEPPEFDAAFFDSVRCNVMREIKQAPEPEGFATLLSRLFNTRSLAYAATLALLVIVALVIVNLRSRNLDDVNRKEQITTTVTNDARDVASPNAPEEVKKVTTPASKQSRQVAANVQRRRLSTQPKMISVAKTIAPPVTSVPESVVGAHSEMAALSNDMNVASGQLASLGGNRQTEGERKVLRIELQTKDPSVRIIWLSPQAADNRIKD